MKATAGCGLPYLNELAGARRAQCAEVLPVSAEHDALLTCKQSDRTSEWLWDVSLFRALRKQREGETETQRERARERERESNLDSMLHSNSRKTSAHWSREPCGGGGATHRRLFMATARYCDPRNFRTLPDKGQIKRLPKTIEGDRGDRNLGSLCDNPFAKAERGP